MVVNLDLVISVDTAVAHLAGALGKPVWLMNRYDTCWRWQANGCGSPWYGTLRQFRQHRPGDWEAAIAAAAAALAETAALPGPARREGVHATRAHAADTRARNAGFGVKCPPPAQGRSSVENRRSQEPQGGLREFGLPEGSGRFRAHSDPPARRGLRSRRHLRQGRPRDREHLRIHRRGRGRVAGSHRRGAGGKRQGHRDRLPRRPAAEDSRPASAGAEDHRSAALRRGHGLRSRTPAARSTSRFSISFRRRA